MANVKRRGFLAAMGASFLAGCTKIGQTEAGQAAFDASESWHRIVHRFLGNGRLVKEYDASAISPTFRGNGTIDPDNAAYRAAAAAGFADWRLEVAGLVERPLSLSMDDIRALPQRSQITRHDCVEGWSAIGQWTGPQLSLILDEARLAPEARFIVFRCADNLNGDDYYESCDLDDAYHPQTIVAHQLNEEPLPIKNGAPLRMRIERQLGYKHAKYLTAIEAVASLDDIGKGKGGYWEDRSGYHWYAGI
ncbi:molybdopterin-dependent oxidoreductase [Altererythrobacter aurantiacus]|uniref:Molybdopterin-dependent oxidoreductase n=1 Tax=Parapontixanthobacter aurantiacus TaxID=1463599 RepID=A0A844ZDD6_9SPHN|nr:molybdopterin-dependent oxidoreductase [Parapontixanthobacter aurantiacus]MXO85554.1 molybdopterin-dependent oxidoreductase [Parapontixanthobacter aurantiacus]